MNKRFPNLLGYHPIIVALSQYPFRVLLLFSSGIVAGIVICWYFFFVMPLRECLAQQRREALLLHEQMARYECRKKEKEDLQKRLLYDYMGDLKKFSKNLQMDPTNEIIKLAKSAHLRCIHVKPVKDAKYTLYDKNWYEASFCGSFQAITTFFEQVTKMPFHVRIERCVLAREKQRIAMTLDICVIKRCGA